MKSKGRIIFLTGISGSGKTTLGLSLQKILTERLNKKVEFIDGDRAREFLGSKLGYSEQERFLVTQQIAFGAYLLAENGIDVLVANIAGKSYVRDYLQSRWGDFITIFLDADINDCITNDTKGIYKKALELKKPNIMGYDIPYDKPDKPDLTLMTHRETIQNSLHRCELFLKNVYNF